MAEVVVCFGVEGIGTFNRKAFLGDFLRALKVAESVIIMCDEGGLSLKEFGGCPRGEHLVNGICYGNVLSL